MTGDAAIACAIVLGAFIIAHELRRVAAGLRELRFKLDRIYRS
jgi:hypothetical protein